MSAGFCQRFENEGNDNCFDCPYAKCDRRSEYEHELENDVRRYEESDMRELANVNQNKG